MPRGFTAFLPTGFTRMPGSGAGPKAVTRLIFGLAVLTLASTQAPAEVIPFTLTEMDMLIAPFSDSGGTFEAVDATGFFGLPPGSPVFFTDIDATVWIDSGDPMANQGSFDTGTGLFAINWAATATFTVLDSAGNSVGSALAQGVIFEDGVVAPFGPPGNFLGSLSTDGFVPLSLTLMNGGGTRLTLPDLGIEINNEKEVIVNVAIETGDIGGVMIQDPNQPSVTLLLPAQLGNVTLDAELQGTFAAAIIPEPATLSLLALGGLMLTRRRR